MEPIIIQNDTGFSRFSGAVVEFVIFELLADKFEVAFV